MHSYSVALRIQLEGKVDFTNSAGGIVGFNGVGNVNLNAGGDVTILNQGEVRGTTFAQSSGGKSASNSSYASITVVDGKGGSSFTEEQSGRNYYVSTGGRVSGTYAGADGTKTYSQAATGNVTQVPDLATPMRGPGP